MKYLERNKLIFDEMRSLPSLCILNEIDRNDCDTTMVYSLGKYDSKLLNKEIHIAYKKYLDRNGIIISHFAARELALFRIIEDKFPVLLEEFPLFHGILMDEKDNEIGIITEDFSKSGKHTVFPEYSNLPFILQNAFGHHIDKSDLATTCFNVNSRRRIGDFGEFFMGLKAKDINVQFPCDDLLNYLSDVTIKLK